MKSRRVHLELTILMAALSFAEAGTKSKFGSVSGSLSDSATGQPISRATIILKSLAEHRLRSAFNYRDLRTGRSLRIPRCPAWPVFPDGKQGRFSRRLGWSQVLGRPGTPISVSTGQSVEGLAFALVPGVVIAGTVQNDGEPLANVTVRALQYKYANHGKRPMPVDKTITNDRGDYRLHNLLPGRYYIACSTNKARALKDNGKAFEGHYPLTFYPSVATLDKAVPLAIDAGNEVIANFLLMATRTYAIRGRISGVDPSPRATLEITTKAAMGDISIGVNVAENNTFGIKGLLPGSYRLLAHGVVSGNPGRGAKSTTIEESDLNDVLIEIGKAAKSLRGHIYVPPNARRDGVRVIVRLQPAITDDDEDNDLPAPVRNDDAMADLSGSFTGVTAERYTKTMFATVVASRPDSEDLFVARVRNDGQDVTGATVSLYPDDRRRIRPDLYHITRADQNGEFTIRGIAPGQYRIIAWEQVESAALNDPEFLTQYENQSVPLNIGPRLKYTVPLAVVPAEAERGIPGR